MHGRLQLIKNDRFIVFTLLLVLPSCISYVKTTPSPLPGIYHTVEKGQTLWRICNNYGVDLQEVAELNNIKEPSMIKEGQKIFIPGADLIKKVIPYEYDATRDKVVLQTDRFIWPVQGNIISQFGMKDGLKYNGIDIAVPFGTPVKAAQAGKVVFSDFLRGYGNTIILDHGGGWVTIYGYHEKNFVKKGALVKQGDVIASVGRQAFHPPQPCLHFQVRKENKARNPLFFLPQP